MKKHREKSMCTPRNRICIFLIGWAAIFIAPLLSSCVYDKQISYTNDQISNLNRKTAGIQESIDEKLSSINSNQAEMIAEVDQLKGDIRELTGRVEDNEYIIKHTVEKDLSEEDAIRAELAKVAELAQKIERLEIILKQQQEYLGLEPFESEEELQEEQEGMETIPDMATLVGEDQKLEEKEIYDLSLSLYREENYEQALESFKRFLNAYPESDLADNAQFWIGECLMSLKEYEQAILAFQDVIKKYPKGNKVANAMFRQAIAFLEIDDKTSSKLLLNKVIKQFPDSSEAENAQKKLKTIK
ncbi:tol-pal system protein YbgF [Deltaproteobacteria bacterium]|nr:tol-pal system protein YbgF [Deltaproteobacteria bacterium]